MRPMISLLSAPDIKDPSEQQGDVGRIFEVHVNSDNIVDIDKAYNKVSVMAAVFDENSLVPSTYNDETSSDKVCPSTECCIGCGWYRTVEDLKVTRLMEDVLDDLILCEKCGLDAVMKTNPVMKTLTEFQIRCEDCGNCDAKNFENYYDFDYTCDTVVCLACETTIILSVALRWSKNDIDLSSSVAESSSRLDRIVPVHGRTRVRSLAMLRPGDHIAWHRDYIIWHHAIVVSVNCSTGVLTIISYNGHPVKLNGHFASVRKEEEIINVVTDELYRYDYDEADFCYAPSEVIVRAESRLGEHNYNPLTSNCEHFARWCKTGHERSYQVDVFCDRMGKLAGSVITKVSEEGAVAATRGLIEGATVEEIFAVGFRSAENLADRIMEYIPGGPTVARGLKWGAIACNMFVNFSIEAANFGIDTWWAYKNYQNGKISRDDFHQGMAKVGCESAGGFLGATVGGFLGQLLIPVPFLGGFLGCTLGNLFGRFVGAVVGKKIRN